MTSTDHSLKYDGAPHTADGELIGDKKSAKGEGHALCSCGWVSVKVSSGARRRAEHKDHKLAVTEEPAPEVQEELLPEVPAEPVQGDPTPAGEDEEDVAAATVKFTDTVSQGFWEEFGKKASRAVADLTGVSVGFNSPAKTTTFTGTRRQVLAAQTHLTDMYSAAADTHKTWKKTSTDYQALTWKTKEGTRAGSKMTRDFWTGYVDAYVSAAADSLI